MSRDDDLKFLEALLGPGLDDPDETPEAADETPAPPPVEPAPSEGSGDHAETPRDAAERVDMTLLTELLTDTDDERAADPPPAPAPHAAAETADPPSARGGSAKTDDSGTG
ncbi:MAG: hypothetical protein ACRDUY_09265, partial [Nitriliruptorales bacterium]